MERLSEKLDEVTEKVEQIAEQRDLWIATANLLGEQLEKAQAENETLQRELAIATTELEKRNG